MVHLKALPGGNACPSWCERPGPHNAHQAQFGSVTVTQLDGLGATALIDRVGPLSHEDVGQLIVDLNIAGDAMEDG